MKTWNLTCFPWATLHWFCSERLAEQPISEQHRIGGRQLWQLNLQQSSRCVCQDQTTDWFYLLVCLRFNREQPQCIRVSSSSRRLKASNVFLQPFKRKVPALCVALHTSPFIHVHVFVFSIIHIPLSLVVQLQTLPASQGPDYFICWSMSRLSCQNS